MDENICHHVADKGMTARIYKEILQLNNKD